MTRHHPMSPGQAAIDLAPLLLVGWGLVLPVHNQDLISRIVLFAAFLALVRVIASDVLPKRLRAKRILILGSGPMADKLIDELEADEDCGYLVAGVVEDGARLAAVVSQVRPSIIVVAFADRRRQLPMEPLLESRVKGIVVEDAVDFYERLTGKMAIEAIKPSMLILSKGFRNHGAAELTARAISVIVATIGLVLTAPLLALLAVLVKLDSRGPVLFVQDRAGRNGRTFGLLKFRTMHPTDQRTTEWVRDNEKRITRVGRILRRCRLDELPQLVNVLRGEMNLVGPRPHPTCNQEIFEKHIAYYRLRSTVRPGVTGWAQVQYGYANNLEEETEKMRFDLYYIKNRSLWLDLRIIAQTFSIMLLGHGATEVVRRTPPPARLRTRPWPAVRRRPSRETREAIRPATTPVTGRP